MLGIEHLRPASARVQHAIRHMKSGGNTSTALPAAHATSHTVEAKCSEPPRSTRSSPIDLYITTYEAASYPRIRATFAVRVASSVNSFVLRGPCTEQKPSRRFVHRSAEDQKRRLRPWTHFVHVGCSGRTHTLCEESSGGHICLRSCTAVKV